MTLRGIETLSVVARDTASKLTELIGAEEVHVCVHVCICVCVRGVQVCIYLHVVCQRAHIEFGKALTHLITSTRYTSSAQTCTYI